MSSRTERPGNKLLRLLDEAAYQTTGAQTKTEHAARQGILYKPNQPIHTVYFPETP